MGLVVQLFGYVTGIPVVAKDGLALSGLFGPRNLSFKLRVVVIVGFFRSILVNIAQASSFAIVNEVLEGTLLDVGFS